jgi:hypothetical protein
MKRRVKSQTVGRFRQKQAAAEGGALRDAAAGFVETHQAEIEAADADEINLDFLGDRDADIWSPLCALCAVIDLRRLPELRRAAATLSAAKALDDTDDSRALSLLRDIRAVWPEGAEKLETALLLERLKAIEDSPWGEQPYPLTPRKLAAMLRPFDVEPRTIRVENRTPKGYYFDDLKDAFTRYLSETSATCETNQ